MKLNVVMFNIFIFVKTFGLEEKVGMSKESCDPWPSHLKSLKECCQLPKRHTCSSEFSCNKMCTEESSSVSLEGFSISQEQVDKIRICMEKCTVRFAYLVNTEKQINKTIALFLYHENDPKMVNWTNQLAEAAEKCEIGSTDSLSVNLAGFFYCLEEHLVKNCLDFDKSDVECNAVEVHYRKCSHIKPDCSAWPLGMIHPKFCCKHPSLFDNQMQTKCWDACDETEHFQTHRAICFNQCILNTTKIITNHKFDYEMIKNVLNKNANESINWKSSIDKAVDECEKNLTGEEL